MICYFLKHIIFQRVPLSDYRLCLPVQLSDFGLASWASSCLQITCTDVAGTFGYAYVTVAYFMF